MKRFLLTILAAGALLPASADEGMWLLPYLKKMNIKDMKEKGLKLSAEDIYSADHSSLKDAIVIFGGGCTGEVVSPNGLVFTNHHCGYGSIQALSSVEHDYLKYGFWAKSNAEEIPAPGLSVTFIRSISDVTPDVIGNIPSIAGQEEYERISGENIKHITKQLEEANPGKSVQVRSFFGGNQFFAFVMDVFRDVRLVGTPPTSIGKFGGETDNWMWPRHTGDFSIFRIYADKDNQPAEYSPENVPYKAETYLNVSLKGYDEGDFAMIMGFPGSTQRYATSYEIEENMKIGMPQRIFLRGARQEILKADMEASDKVRIQYASKYASSSNYWKNSIGMMRGIEKLNVKAKKEAQEAEFQKWAIENTFPEEGFQTALSDMKEAVEGRADIVSAASYLSEGLLMPVEIISIARIVNGGKDVSKEEMIKRVENFYKNYNLPTDRKVAHRMLEIVQQKSKNLPSVFADVIDSQFGGDTHAYVDYLYDNSIFTDEDKVKAYVENPTEEAAEAVKNDPAVVLANSVVGKFVELSTANRASGTKVNGAHRRYIKGLMRQYPDKAWASDANFTIRLTYGNVLPYDPADGVKYNYFTTLKGVMEKEDESNPMEFTVPERLKEIYRTKDYGRYADKNGEMPVCFLANCDITGGNSGSPVLNAKGELIGLAFDGNWEAMSGDIAFEPELQRTIAVDVRYVLMVIDKFAGAGWLLDELTIK
ncbi:MAG: S46 family peptidase [Alistipes sp.]|nr:S46 family peptidase [Alistipes sp.]